MRCKAKRRDGKPCSCQARPGKRWCIAHDPATAAARAAGQRKGGAVRTLQLRPPTLPPDTPDLVLRTVADVVAALGATVNQVRTGRLGVQVGNCLGQLLQVLLKAIEGGEVERLLTERLAALEARHPSRRDRS